MWKGTHIQEAKSTRNKTVNRRRQDGRGREDLKSCSLSDGFILPSSEEDGIDICYGTVLIVFARFLISRPLVVVAVKTNDIGHTTHES